MSNLSSYHEPLALVIISSISIGIAAIFSAWIAFDIVTRRGWRTMMAVMIPVYVVNALYLWPITLWTYLQYGRPLAPLETHGKRSCHNDKKGGDVLDGPQEGQALSRGGLHHVHADSPGEALSTSKQSHADAELEGEHMGHMHASSERPMFATVTIGVCHCGAGCVLGDIVGEWLVYGTNAKIGNPPRLIWVEFLVDFAFAFAFGIVFQYFSIAPMANQYGLKTVVRALKADTLSLVFFEIGLFGWMAAFQIGIFNYRLEMNTVTYWWMMQIGMFLGHWTGVPINW